MSFTFTQCTRIQGKVYFYRVYRNSRVSLLLQCVQEGAQGLVLLLVSVQGLTPGIPNDGIPNDGIPNCGILKTSIFGIPQFGIPGVSCGIPN